MASAIRARPEQRRDGRKPEAEWEEQSDGQFACPATGDARCVAYGRAACGIHKQSGRGGGCGPEHDHRAPSGSDPLGAALQFSARRGGAGADVRQDLRAGAVFRPDPLAPGLHERPALVRDGSPLRRAVASGEDFAPQSAVAAPAGSFVRRVARTPHYDGVRKIDKEPAIIAITGMGPISYHLTDPEKPGWRRSEAVEEGRRCSSPPPVRRSARRAGRSR